MHIFGIIFDWIFPPSDKELYVRSLSPEKMHVLYRQMCIKNAEALASYKNPQIRALIHEAKFYNNSKAQILLGVFVQKYLEHHSVNFDVIIPIPLSKKRLRDRGHNQVVSVLKHVTFREDITIAKNTVIRTKNTKPQTELPKEKRINNMNGVFEVSNPEQINGKRILLIDDVVTTGATLSAAKASLLQHSPTSVTCLAFAH